MQGKLLTEFETLLVQAFQLDGILADAVYLHRTQGTDAGNTALILHTFEHLQLGIVDGNAMAQCHPKARITLIDKREQLKQKAETLIASAEKELRKLNDGETNELNSIKMEISKLDDEIKQIEKRNQIALIKVTD